MATLKVIRRGTWGARYDDGCRAAPLPASYVYLHHSVTQAPDLEWLDANRDGVDDDERAAMRTLESIGESRFGCGISYTALVVPSGRIYEGHGVGRQGTHTGGLNDRARAICFVGNYETNVPTAAQLRSAAWLLQEWKRNGVITRARLTGGHRDAPGAATACPGRYAYAAIGKINTLAAGPPITDDAPIEEDDMSAEDVRAIREDIASLRGLVAGPNLDYTIDGEEKTGSLRTTVAYTRQDVRAVLRAVQGLAEALNAEALAASVAEEINRLDAEDVVDALGERLGAADDEAPPGA